MKDRSQPREYDPTTPDKKEAEALALQKALHLRYKSEEKPLPLPEKTCSKS